MEYRCEAASVEGFVRFLSSNILPHGYWFYVSGFVPEGKDPRAVDRKLVEKYGIGISRSARARRKANGLANLHYLRHGRRFFLLATHGEHAFHRDERAAIRDARTHPIHFAGYSISVKRGGFLRKSKDEDTPTADGRMRVRVQIGRERFKELLAYFVDLAPRRSAEELAKELYSVPFEPFAVVRRQMLKVLSKVNRARGAAGLEKLPPSVLRYHRQPVRPFDLVDGGGELPRETCRD